MFLKETSNEYYNLALDRYYDAEDGNVWLSFPSSERNKISEESYLITKKQHDNSQPVTSLSRYRILSISNEAPDFIKTVKSALSSSGVKNQSPISTGALGFAFEGPSPEVDPQFGPRFNGNKITFSLGNFTSDFYEVQLLRVVNVTGADALYELSLKKGIGADAEFLTNVGVNSIYNINIFEDKEETSPEYQGRFFVKIPRDFSFDSNIMESFQALDPQYSILGVQSFTLNGGATPAKGIALRSGAYWLDWGNNYLRYSLLKLM